MSSHHTDPNVAHVSAAADHAAGDSTERGLLERAFDRATLLASVEELVKLIAHDVNQPLGAALMTARACRRGLATGSLSPEQVRDGLDRLVADVERVSEILGQLRAATRQPSAVLAPTDINAVIQCALADAAPDAARLGVTPVTNLASGLLPVSADPQRLQHVVRTLIGQALDAMASTAENDRSLTLRSTLTTPSEVTVAVEDGGPGVSATEAPRVFELFTATRRGRIGLELAVCRAIVEDHDGRIWAVASERGAVFCFTLPTADAR